MNVSRCELTTCALGTFVPTMADTDELVTSIGLLILFVVYYVCQNMSRKAVAKHEQYKQREVGVGPGAAESTPLNRHQERCAFLVKVNAEHIPMGCVISVASLISCSKHNRLDGNELPSLLHSITFSVFVVCRVGYVLVRVAMPSDEKAAMYVLDEVGSLCVFLLAFFGILCSGLNYTLI